ncbi:DNA (cytosine-5-)-methyltransferase [Pseudidiomarina gelatinasegens]|uniref:Cytosine-specific methyltransferase n=1 Tax=Pseudidiomarina gelatinasegens TaxID=2487740 RepID=A0A443YVJ8_9GAMM|nr:DNA (cytosine-5-)-methyltransferase [Pseudidiomarina gelatinasegens]RWU07969.1 DNA (cytosine-5-)-methyltransferase [Pseudidiomarina gelatinasegens]
MNKINNNINAKDIKCIRERLGLGRTEFANLLGLGNQGERTVRGWETEEHKPSKSKAQAILLLEEELERAKCSAPFAVSQNNSSFRFIDLFAGIGGIRLPFQQLGGECVFSSEWDKFAQKTYLSNFGEMPHGDITKIKAADIPDHDILLGGFPCQAFSQAGLKKGFGDTRGTMFFEIQRILVEKRPKAFLLENVKQLKGHDKGRTLKTIEAILKGEFEQGESNDIQLSEEARHALSEKLNYWVDYRVLRAADFGAPQNRERVYIVGFDKDYFSESDINQFFSWPEPPRTPTLVGDILEDLSELSCDEDRYTISDRLWSGHKKRKEEHQEKGNGFGYSLVRQDTKYTNTISARYYKDGSEILIDQSGLGKNPRKLTPRECARLQGFPEEFIVDAVSHGQIYKQFGNSVCMNVVRAIATEMVSFMGKASNRRKSAA